MSQENVEIVRVAFEAAYRRDWDRVFEEATRDFELDLSRGVGPDSGVYRGAQAKQIWSDFGEHWASWRIESREFIDAGEHVVVTLTSSLRGRDGIEVEAEVVFTFTVREGKLARMAYYPTRKDALEAVGRRE